MKFIKEAKTENILNKKLKRIKLINQQILDKLLTPENITKSQEKQILKLEQEKYIKKRANYFEKLKELTNAEFAK